MDFHIVVGY